MTPTIREIQEAVALRWDVTVLDIKSRRGNSHIVRPRHVAMWLARHLTEHSLQGIGRLFGGRDLKSVRYAIDRVNAARATDPTLNRALVDLANQLGGDVPCLIQPRLELVA